LAESKQNQPGERKNTEEFDNFIYTRLGFFLPNLWNCAIKSDKIISEIGALFIIELRQHLHKKNPLTV
jgi:hypothetical protein